MVRFHITYSPLILARLVREDQIILEQFSKITKFAGTFSLCSESGSNWNFKMLIFREKGNSEEISLGPEWSTEKVNTFMAQSQGINPGSLW